MRTRLHIPQGSCISGRGDVDESRNIKEIKLCYNAILKETDKQRSLRADIQAPASLSGFIQMSLRLRWIYDKVVHLDNIIVFE